MAKSNATATLLAQLKARLLDADQDVSGTALGALIGLGKAATPLLIEALSHANARTRRLAAEGLGDIAERASADALYQATHDSSGEVRARAATALHRLHDARALPALIATLNDYPDILHAPYTASMYPLMRAGKAVLPLLIPLLRAADALTGERALLVIKAVVGKHYPQHDWNTLWRSLGSYDPAAPQPARERAAQQWQDWLAAQSQPQ
jgi:HEAT repeat protein